jgi:eukaryotic-like serine/threonine-protein kinase
LDPMGIEVAAEMGAAVLLRVPRTVAEREPASILVVRGEAGWRLREIFD